MIGLEGGWGSGKTTVVNLVRAKLSGIRSVKIVTFDAWAHEGDPLRRTFLESLIEALVDLGWAEKEKWQKALLELSHRRKSSTTRTIPKSSLLARWLGAAALVVPIGLVFLKRALDDGLTWGLHLKISGNFLIGFPLSVAPFIVLLVFLALEKKGKLKTEFNWNFLEGTEIKDETQETTETPQPTSIEFESRFRQLMDEALNSKDQRFLTVVLDNLDRVNVRDALTIWATLQTFLHHNGERSDSWFERLCVIVPYDPSGLRQLWERHQEGPRPAGGQTLDERYAESQTVVSDSFIDKSFQLRFDVPPLVLSDWKSYLRGLISKALPAHSEDDSDLIYRVYRASRATDRPPTPRQLKHYVNEIGVAHRQWQHRFPIGHIAYFASIRRQHEDLNVRLLDGKLPTKQVSSLFPEKPDLNGSLAGLHFNVPAEHGLQLLLSQPIANALNSPNTDDLRRLAAIHQGGFWATLEDTTETLFTDMDAAAFTKAAVCLEKSGLLDERREAKTVKHNLGDRARKIFPWPLRDPSVLEGAQSACRLANDRTVSKSVAAAIRDSLTTEHTAETPNAALITQLANFRSTLLGLGHDEAVVERFRIPCDVDQWIQLCPEVMKLDAAARSSFAPPFDFAEFRNKISDAVETGQFVLQALSAIVLSTQTFERRDWAPLAQRIEQRLQFGKNTRTEEVDWLLHALALLRADGCSDTNEVAERLANQGHLMHWFQLGQGNTSCKSWCILTFLTGRPDGSQPGNIGNSAAGHQAFRSLLKTDDAAQARHMVEISRAHGFDVIFPTAINLGFEALVVRCLRIAADGHEPEQIFTPENFVRTWNNLKQHLPEEGSQDRFLKLAIRLRDNSDLVAHLESTGFKPQLAGLYQALCSQNPPIAFLQWCRSGLRDMDAGTWTSELAEYGEGLQLALEIGGEGGILGMQFLDGVVAFAKDLVQDNARAQPALLQNMTQALALLDQASHAVLGDHLYRQTIPLDGNCGGEFFELFGSELIDGCTAAAANDPLARLLSPIIQQRNSSALRWVQRLLHDYPGILGTLDANLVREFRERLRDEEENEDEPHALIEAIRETVGVDRREEPTPEQS